MKLSQNIIGLLQKKDLSPFELGQIIESIGLLFKSIIGEMNCNAQFVQDETKSILKTATEMHNVIMKYEDKITDMGLQVCKKADETYDKVHKKLRECKEKMEADVKDQVFIPYQMEQVLKFADQLGGMSDEQLDRVVRVANALKEGPKAEETGQ